MSALSLGERFAPAALALALADNSANTAAALLSGQIQGALIAPPESTKLIGSGFKVMYDLSELKFPATGQVIVIPRRPRAGQQRLRVFRRLSARARPLRPAGAFRQ
jgi:hypothetical protein